MKFSSFLVLALVEKLWLPVTTVGSSEKGSTTRTLEWMIALPMFALNCLWVVSAAHHAVGWGLPSG